jgi:hypothetical protein
VQIAEDREGARNRLWAGVKGAVTKKADTTDEEFEKQMEVNQKRVTECVTELCRDNEIIFSYNKYKI